MAADETVSRGVVEELKSKVKSGQAFLEQKERLEASMKQLQDSLNSERSEFARKFRCASMPFCLLCPLSTSGSSPGDIMEPCISAC